MTHLEATSPDRGLQAERTALAWTRTSLSVVVSGLLVLLREHSMAGLSGRGARAEIVIAAAVVALAVFTVGMLRRRAITVRPLPRQARARRSVQLVGISIVTLTLLVVTYLVLGT